MNIEKRLYHIGSSFIVPTGVTVPFAWFVTIGAWGWVFEKEGLRASPMALAFALWFGVYELCWYSRMQEYHGPWFETDRGQAYSWRAFLTDVFDSLVVLAAIRVIELGVARPDPALSGSVPVALSARDEGALFIGIGAIAASAGIGLPTQRRFWLIIPAVITAFWGAYGQHRVAALAIEWALLSIYVASVLSTKVSHAVDFVLRPLMALSAAVLSRLKKTKAPEPTAAATASSGSESASSRGSKGPAGDVLRQ